MQIVLRDRFGGRDGSSQEANSFRRFRAFTELVRHTTTNPISDSLTEWLGLPLFMSTLLRKPTKRKVLPVREHQAHRDAAHGGHQPEHNSAAYGHFRWN